MTRAMICFILAALLIPAMVHAQEKPFVEIGTKAGFTFRRYEEATITHMGIPGLGILGQPGIYFSFLAADPVFVEPQLAVSHADYENGSVTNVGFGALIGYLFEGAAASSPFVAVDFGFEYENASGSRYYGYSDSDFGLGFSAGYRFLIGERVGFRVEGGFRRWIDGELNEFQLGVGIGGIVHRIRYD